MNAQLNTESTGLVVIPPETALAVYTADKGLDPYLAKIKQETDGFIPDTTTKKGRDAIASMSYKVSQSKTYLDKTGKDLVDKLKEQPKLVDAERKRMRDYLDGLRDDVRKPLTEWEDAEELRVAELNQRLYAIQKITEISDQSAADLQNDIDWLCALPMDESWQEFQPLAIIAKDKTFASLTDMLAKRKAYDAEQAELTRLREEAALREQKEREERIAREAAEAERLKAAREAEAEKQRVEAAAQAERDAVAKREAEAKAEAERKELELKLVAEKAQREALEAQQAAEYERQRAGREIEAERRERERQAEIAAAALKAREKDKEHKKTINNKAVADFVAGGMTEECAKNAVTLIARRSISNITISY